MQLSAFALGKFIHVLGTTQNIAYICNITLSYTISGKIKFALAANNTTTGIAETFLFFCLLTLGRQLWED